MRSTLAAKAYSVSEGTESGVWVRRVLREVYNPSLALKQIDDTLDPRQLIVVTDNNNLATKIAVDKKMTSDKRLGLVVAMLREAFRTVELHQR